MDMQIDILTLFPESVDAMLNVSILGRAQERGYIAIRTHQIRAYTTNKQMQVDDYPYGGGRGAVMQADPLFRCWEHVVNTYGPGRTIFMSPCGRTFTQSVARELKAQYDHLILVCGHYEGIDQRFIDACVDEELSMGDFVLTGGEIPAMAVADAVCRMVPGVLLAVALCVYVYFIAKKRNYPRTAPPKLRDYLLYLTKSIWAMLTPVILLVGIYTGIMTPTEAAAIAAFYGLIVGLFLYKEMDFKCLINSCIESCETSAVIIVLMAMATLFGNIMTIEDVPGTVARAILSFSENKIVILMLINVLLLIVGTFMEALAAIVILVPILLPIVTGVGVSPLHFGVIIVVNLAIGFITPPVGVNLFVASGVAKAKLENIASQALPMIALMLIVLLICTYIPEVPLILVGGPH